MERSEVERIVYIAIDRVNELLLEDTAIPKDPSTALLGDGAALDSMGFVNFVVAVEDLLASEADLALNLVGELNAQNDDAEQPESIGQFVDFIATVALRKKN